MLPQKVRSPNPSIREILGKFYLFLHLRSELCSRVVFRGWDCSHSIRSENLLRYWCPDFFSTSSKNIFSIDPKKKFGNFRKSENFRDFRDFQKSRKFPKKSLLFSLKIFENFRTFFLIDRNFFFGEVEKKYGHQYRSKISLRIEWEHSQSS